LDIEWELDDVQLSDKDKHYKSFKEFETPFI